MCHGAPRKPRGYWRLPKSDLEGPDLYGLAKLLHVPPRVTHLAWCCVTRWAACFSGDQAISPGVGAGPHFKDSMMQRFGLHDFSSFSSRALGTRVTLLPDRSECRRAPGALGHRHDDCKVLRHACGGQRKTYSDHLQQSALSTPPCRLQGVKLRPAGSAASGFAHWAILPALPA